MTVANNHDVAVHSDHHFEFVDMVVVGYTSYHELVGWAIDSVKWKKQLIDNLY